MFLSAATVALSLVGPGGSHAHRPPPVEARFSVARSEVVLLVGPLHVPAATHYHDHGRPDDHLDLVWPATGWLQGYSIDLVDAAGRPLPREMLHHVGVVNPARRQLAYDAEERLFAVGQETGSVTLPGWMGLPIEAGTKLGVYYALVNPTERAIEGASLRITARWRPESTDRSTGLRRPYPRPYHPMQRVRREPRAITEVRPFVVGAGPDVGGSGTYDLPAGRSTRNAEFRLAVGGRIRALGAHLHDYASEIRIEDVATGEVLVRLRARTDDRGRLESVERTYFMLKRGGLALEAERAYRVVAVYDNPTGRVIEDGAMAYMAGPFIPDATE